MTVRASPVEVVAGALDYVRQGEGGQVVANRNGPPVGGTDQPPLSAEEILAAYAKGKRDFRFVNADGIQLVRANLREARFLGASLREANFENAILTHVQFKAADLRGARLAGAMINATDLIATRFDRANLSDTDLTGAAMNGANCTSADMRKAVLGNARLDAANLTHARLRGAYLSATNLSNIDATPFCNIKLRQDGPSIIDPRTVIKSYQTPGFKRFMLDCGVPEIFAEYMIDCARATSESLWRTLMQTTFISYGGPDETFAQKLYYALREHNVVTFYFPVSATLGERIDSEVFRRIQEHDRVILICSRNSLDRAGVLNEIQETFDREARDGGATYLLPVTLDDYVFTGWRTIQPELAERVGRRVVGDFRRAARSKRAFDEALDRLLDALKIKRPSS
jgi:hypothetical protein